MAAANESSSQLPEGNADTWGIRPKPITPRVVLDCIGGLMDLRATAVRQGSDHSGRCSHRSGAAAPFRDDLPGRKIRARAPMSCARSDRTIGE